MHPTRYAAALAHPMSWQALYWIDRLLQANTGDTSSFEKEHGSPEFAQLVASNALTTLTAETLTLKAQYTTVSSSAGSQDRVLVTCEQRGEQKGGQQNAQGLSADDAGGAPSPMAESIGLLLRCMGMPPRRSYFEASAAVACLTNGHQLGREILADMTSQGRDADWLVASKVLIELEDLSTVHHQACVDVLNNPYDDVPGEPGVYECLSKMESRIQSRVDALCAEHKLSPMTLSFNRDARGCTLRVVGRQAVDEWHSKVSYRERQYVVVANYMRESGSGLSAVAQAIDLRHKQSLAKLKSSAKPEAARPTGVIRVTEVAGPGAVSTLKAGRTKKPKVTAPAPAVIATQRCSEEVLAILRQGSWTEGGHYKLPEGQLPRKLYEQVRDYIALAEGKWVSGSGSFRFSNGGEDRMRAGILSGEMVNPKDNGFFPTPSDLAAELVGSLDLRPGMKVLEPSAGRGALALEAAKLVGIENVTCYELLPQNAKRLREMGFTVIEGDFLQAKPSAEFDAVVMNPPFSRLSDVRHVVHATRFVRPAADGYSGGKVAAIMSPSFQHVQSKDAEVFRRQFIGDSCAGKVLREVEAGAFKESGTDVRTTMVHLDVSKIQWGERFCAQQLVVDEVPEPEEAQPLDATSAYERHAA